MKARVIRIGNSQGILIPGRLLLAAGLRDEVELSTGHGVLMIRPVQAPRAGLGQGVPGNGPERR